MSRGAGDRRGFGALRAAGDRPALGRIRTRRATLLGLNLQRVAVVDLVIGDEIPQLVTFAGNPFLICGDETRGDLTFLEIRAYRVDCLVIAEAGQ